MAGGSGFNVNVPDPAAVQLEGNKTDVYERQQVRREKDRRMQSLSDLAGRLLEGKGQTDSVSGPNGSIRQSADTYERITEQLESFYETPQETAGGLEQKVDELNRRLEEAEAENRRAESRERMMEQSYRMAARYLNPNPEGSPGETEGTRVVIEGGALDIPTFIIGGAEIPQDALLLAFKASDIDVAAGPEGLSIVTAPQAPDSGGSNFAQEVPGIGDAGPPIDLLDPTALQFGALEAPQLGSDINFAPVIEFLPGGVSLIDVIVDEDALGGDEDGNFDPGGDPIDGSPPVDPDGTDPDKNSGNTEVVTGAFQLSDPQDPAQPRLTIRRIMPPPTWDGPTLQGHLESDF